MKKWTVYRIQSEQGKELVFLTNDPIEALSSFLGGSTIRIILTTTKKSHALKVYEKEQIEVSIVDDDARAKYAASRARMAEFGRKYGPKNGVKVGAIARDSGHLKRLRETKVLCPDGHRSNLQYYKFYCRNRGLDPNKAIILKKSQEDERC